MRVTATAQEKPTVVLVHRAAEGDDRVGALVFVGGYVLERGEGRGRPRAVRGGPELIVPHGPGPGALG